MNESRSIPPVKELTYLCYVMTLNSNLNLSQVVHTGVRVFELRNETKGQTGVECHYRVNQEGINIISKHASAQVFSRLVQHLLS